MLAFLNTPSAALVIPCFNEHGRAEPFLRQVLEECPDLLVVTVDDGSAVPLGPSDHPAWICLSYPKNRGKGHAIRHGWNWITRNHPEIPILGFCDADGAVSAGELSRLLGRLHTTGADLLVGSRVKMLGRRIRRDPVRHYIGRVYATLVSVMLDLPSYDTQCGCKWILRKAWDAVAGEVAIDRFAFDAELMVRLLRKRFTVVEEPVDWSEQSSSRVRLFRDSVNMACDIWRLRRKLHES